MLYPHSSIERKKHVQQRNLKYKKTLEERFRGKWLKFRRKEMKVRKRRKEVLVSDLVEKDLQENQHKRNNVLSSSRKTKLRGRAMVFEQQGIPLIKNKATTVHSSEENETILSSASFIRTVEDKVYFISETRSCPLNVPDISRKVNSSFDEIPNLH